MPRRIKLVTLLEEKDSINLRGGELHVTFTVTDAVAEWLELAIDNARPSDFETFSDDIEEGTNIDGLFIKVLPEGV